MAVYFIRNTVTGNIKIGHASDPMRRLMALQSGNEEPLRFIRIIDGGAATEAWLHKRFAPCRMRGEWFQFHEDMVSVCPPDEVPPRPGKRSLKLTLRETIQQHDRFPILNDDRLLAVTLVAAFSEEDAAAFIEWARDRVAAR